MPPLPYLKIATYALAAVLGFISGWQVNGWRHDAQALAKMEADQEAIQAAVAQAKKIAALRDANIDTAAQLAVERSRKAKVIERVITNDVIKFVQTPAAAVPCLDDTGVRLINTASGVPADPDTTGSSNAGTGAATAAAVVSSVTTNYQICQANADQLRALQDWVKALR